MADLLAAMNVSSVDWSDDVSVIRHYIYNSHCSVLVKLADDLSELYAGHTTWSGYAEGRRGGGEEGRRGGGEGNILT